MAKLEKKAVAKKKAAPKKGQAAAERKKKGASAARGTKAVQPVAPKPEAGRKLPGKSSLKELMKEVLVFDVRSAENGGKARQLVSEAAKKGAVNAPVFGYIKKLLKMGRRDPVALRTYLDDLDYYKDVFEIEKLAGDSLFDDREGAQDADEDETGDSAGDTETADDGGVVDLSTRRTGTDG